MDINFFTESEMEELKRDFIIETSEHLDNAQEGLVGLEGMENDRELLNSIFREIHTIKGSANFLGFKEIVDVAHTMEDILDKMRNFELDVHSEVVDCLLIGIDLLRELVGSIDGAKAVEKQKVNEYISHLREVVYKVTSFQPLINNEKNEIKTFEDDEGKIQSILYNADSDDNIENKIVVFEYQNQLYGIEIEFVREVVKMYDITQIPFTDKSVLGIMNLRGEIITIIDFGTKIGLSSDAKMRYPKAIILNFNGILLGIGVESVKEVITISGEKTTHQASLEKDQSKIGVIKKIIEHEDKFIEIINIKEFLKQKS